MCGSCVTPDILVPLRTQCNHTIKSELVTEVILIWLWQSDCAHSSPHPSSFIPDIVVQTGTKKTDNGVFVLKLSSSWLTSLTYSLVHCLSWVKWLNFPTFNRVNVFLKRKKKVFVPWPTQLSFQTVLFGFLPQSEGWIQWQTGGLCSPGTGSLVVDMTLILYYSWVRGQRGWQYIIFETWINKSWDLSCWLLESFALMPLCS